MKRLSIQGVQDRLSREPQPILVEALPEEHYANSHLPNAVNIPKDQVDDLAPRLLPDTNAEIIVYCANTECAASAQVAERLIELGYTHVSDFEAGKKGWLEAGLPVEKGIPTFA